MNSRSRDLFLATGIALAALILVDAAAIAQTGRNPFAVAGNEGSVTATGIGGWLLAQQTYFYKMINNAVREAKLSGSAVWTLAGISFAYGVFHAAGPGHGKAVVASYMIANERALKRGLVISFMAALLQGIVAIVIVTVAALVIGATAQRITQASDIIEALSYAGVTLLGAWLVWRKIGAFAGALRDKGNVPGHEPAAHRHGGCRHDHDHEGTGSLGAHAPDPGHVHDEHCGHFHAPDPNTLGEGFSWKTALLTVFSAGSRPCSGAILVLVFALAQGIFAAGIAATFAMSLGTAITTGALASMAVLFKGLAVKLAGGRSRRGELIARGVEVAAAAGVLLVGVALLSGAMSSGA